MLPAELYAIVSMRYFFSVILIFGSPWSVKIVKEMSLILIFSNGSCNQYEIVYAPLSTNISKLFFGKSSPVEHRITLRSLINAQTHSIDFVSI